MSIEDVNVFYLLPQDGDDSHLAQPCFVHAMMASTSAGTS